MEKLSRWWYILRYHHKSQLVMRLVAMARRRWLGWTGGRRYSRSAATPPKLRENAGLGSLLAWKLRSHKAQGASSKAREILENRFTFLGETHRLPLPIDWRLERRTETPRLWRFHLHYHEYLLDLVAATEQKGTPSPYVDRAWVLAADWIENNRLADPRVLDDAWHPYCISRRLPAWISLWVASAPEEALAGRVLASMTAQARFLRDHLEWDLGGNHLLENAKALAVVGAFLEGPEADGWLWQGGKILRKQLAEQVLPHGEHFERSPMYHAAMLDAVLDVRDATRDVEPALSDLCDATAAKMARFLRKILHPDGEIPLLGDSCFGESAPVDQSIARAFCPVSEQEKTGNGSGSKRPDSKDSEAVDPADRSASSASATILGNTWVFRDGGDFFLFDAGPVGPDHLPAHAHADLLNLEASIQGHRVFVDSGVFNYRDDTMRQYCRSSAAHNVLMVDDTEQCDMWSRFRMAYRGWPFGFSTGETHGFHWARARHNAYRRCRVSSVGRWVACRPGGPWFCVDWAEAAGSHKLTNRLHLHPEMEAEQTAPGVVRIHDAEIELLLQFLSPGQVELATGWYCPQFGQRLRCHVVEWTTITTLPAMCAWCLTRQGPTGNAFLTPWEGYDTILTWGDQSGRVSLRPIGKTFG